MYFGIGYQELLVTVVTLVGLGLAIRVVPVIDAVAIHVVPVIDAVALGLGLAIRFALGLAVSP